MAKWIVKATLQKVISLFPYGYKANNFFQKHVTKRRLDDSKMEQALIHCTDHVRHFEAHRARDSGFATLELGTGWYPIVPIGLFLCGADSVTTVDLTPWMLSEQLSSTVQRFREYHERDRLRELLPSIKADRVSELLSLAGSCERMGIDDVLGALRIRYLVADARRLPLSDACIDLVHSNNVLEHVYPDVLREILAEFKRVARADSVMSHFIDMTDHFSHSDASIDAYHFLRYSDALWKLIDNPIAPQNRLRLNEYRALYERQGIVITDEKANPADPAAVAERLLAPRFRSMRKSEVSVQHAYLISKFAVA